MPRFHSKPAAKTSPPIAAKRWPVELWIALLLVVLTVAAYWQVRRYDFVNYDDPLYVSQNPHVRAGLTSQSLAWAMTSGEGANWFPVTRLSYLLDSQLFGLDPAWFHLTNLFFHVLTALLLFALLRLATGSPWSSAFVAAMFALHPLHVESVAWITERKDVLSGFFWFAAMLAYLRYVRRPSLGRYLLVAVLFCLGLMAKPVVVTLPFALLLLDVWPLRRISLDARPKSAVLLEKAPLLALSLAASIVTYLVQAHAGVVGTLDSLPLSRRLGDALVSYAVYILQVFWPTRLSAFYPYAASLPLWQVASAGIALLAVTAVAIQWRRSRPWLAIGWFWFLGTLVPMIGLVKVGAAAHADRYTYLSAVGLWIVLAWGAAELVERLPPTKPLIAGLGAVSCAACLSLTWLQTGYWENSIALFRHAIDVTHGNYVAYNNLGLAQRNQGLIYEAIGSFGKALEIRPAYFESVNNLSDAYGALGDFQQMARYSVEALKINPASAEAHGNLGAALGQLGKTAEAEAEFRQALRLRADDPKIHNDLGIALGSQGKIQQAMAEFQEAVRLDPEYGNAQFNLGATLANTGHLREAAAHLLEAVRIHPDDQRARQSLQMVAARLQGAGKQ